MSIYVFRDSRHIPLSSNGGYAQEVTNSEIIDIMAWQSCVRDGPPSLTSIDLSTKPTSVQFINDAALTLSKICNCFLSVTSSVIYQFPSNCQLAKDFIDKLCTDFTNLSYRHLALLMSLKLASCFVPWWLCLDQILLSSTEHLLLIDINQRVRHSLFMSTLVNFHNLCHLNLAYFTTKSFRYRAWFTNLK